MKKILLAFSFTISLATLAQNNKAELITKMSNEACAVIEKTDISGFNKDNFQQEIGMLLVPIMSDNMEAIKKYYNIETPTQENFKEVGMDLGMKLSGSCKKFMEFSMSLSKELLSKPEATTKPKKETFQTTSLTGILADYTPADIAFITIKDAKGKVQKIYWMEYFENADNFETNMKKYIGKKITLTYAERDVYDAAKKGYKNIKVIASIELM